MEMKGLQSSSIGQALTKGPSQLGQHEHPESPNYERGPPDAKQFFLPQCSPKLQPYSHELRADYAQTIEEIHCFDQSQSLNHEGYLTEYRRHTPDPGA